jgi:hypothetical protein
MDGKQVLEDDLEPVGFDWSKLRKTHPPELVIRFLFGAAIALVAAIAGQVFGPKVGGLFLAFPAILPATLTLIEKKEGTAKAWADASGGALGAVGLAAFAFVTLRLMATKPVLALLIALVAWLAVSAGLYFLFRMSGIFVKQDELLAKRD